MLFFGNLESLVVDDVNWNILTLGGMRYLRGVRRGVVDSSHSLSLRSTFSGSVLAVFAVDVDREQVVVFRVVHVGSCLAV
jgi:hypothetical protein